MYSKKFLAENTRPEEKATAFVLMPFAQEFDPIFGAVKRTLEGDDLRVRCYRADEVYKPEPIIESILRGIVTSELIIADLTGRNPNVFYELGIAHCVKDNCIILTQSMDDVPFDLQHLRCIVYENSLRGAEELRLALTNAVRVCMAGVVPAAVRAGHRLFGETTATELSYEKWTTGYQSDRMRTKQEAESARERLFQKVTAAIAGLAGLEDTKVDGAKKVLFPDGYALSELRDESVGGQRGVRFAASLLVAINSNPRFSANDFAVAFREQPHRISFILDGVADIQAIFRFVKEHSLGVEGLSNDSVEISLDSLASEGSYRDKNWRVLATNRSGTGRLELFMTGTSYRVGPSPIRGDVGTITPDRIVSVLDGSLPLTGLIGGDE